MKEWLIANADWFTPLSGFLGSLAGACIVALALIIGISSLKKVQDAQFAVQQKSEASLRKREKIVIAAALAGELTEDKIKCESFITIYNELLRNLRDTSISAQYEETSDFIHRHPPLSRAVFDANVDKIAIFGTKLAGELAGTYAAVRQEAEYQNLERAMPRAAAVRMVEMVIEDARKTMEPMDVVISALNIIVRGSTQD